LKEGGIASWTVVAGRGRRTKATVASERRARVGGFLELGEIVAKTVKKHKKPVEVRRREKRRD
jgi:hypothetical protein